MRPNPEKAASYARAGEDSLARRRARQPGGATRVGAAASELSLRVHGDLAGLESLWSGFEDRGCATFYQSFLWCRSWAETVGLAWGVRVRVVVATDVGGETRFILPLQIRRRSGVRVVEWLGAPHNAYGQGLVAGNFLPRAGDWFEANWTAVVRLAGPADAVCLAAMPESLDGTPNPLRFLFTLKAPDRTFVMALDADYPALYARKRTREARLDDRRKERALAALATPSFGLPEGTAALHETIAAMFEQRQRRLAEIGVHGTFGGAERAFVHRLADLQDAACPALLAFELKSGGETLAVKLGARHRGTFFALLSALGARRWRKYSPGDLALRRTIEACCEAGLVRFDFAAGDAAYKRQWADADVALHVHLSAFNLRGLAWVVAAAAGLSVKRLIKQNPPTRALAYALRRRLLGTSGQAEIR